MRGGFWSRLKDDRVFWLGVVLLVLGAGLWSIALLLEAGR